MPALLLRTSQFNRKNEIVKNYLYYDRCFVRETDKDKVVAQRQEK